MFVFPAPYVAAGPDLIVTLTDDSASSANAATYNFTSQSFGSSTVDDYLVVTVAGLSNISYTLDSLTVDGEAATIITGASSILVTNHILAAIAIVPATGNASGTVTPAFSGTLGACGIGLFRVQNLQSTTATDTGGDSGASPSDTLNVSAGGAAFGVVCHNNTTSTWTNLTERFESSMQGSTSHTAAMDVFSSAQAGLAISNGATTDVVMALASFR